MRHSLPHSGGSVRACAQRIRARGNEVEIRVVNTVGAPARTRGHGLALKNVKQRLRLMHDVAARIEVAPSPTRFMVRILLPR